MAGAQRDFGRLEEWLGARAALGSPCRIVDCSRPTNGFSAETLLLSIETGASAPRSLVLRIAHPQRTIFVDASITRQARMMRGLGARGIPVPAVLGWDEDPSILGAPFLVMERRAGKALPQHPSYHVAGLLLELDQAGRRRAWREALETIARINRLDWRTDFAFLIDPPHGAPGLDHYLGWIRAWRARAWPGAHPVIDPAIDYLVTRQPAGMPAELLWGDSNAGNMLFAADGSLDAVLDFEAASIGPGEIDLGWWFFVDKMLAAGNSLPPGMPDRLGQIALYEQALGRKVVHLDYFEILAALRMALVIARSSQFLVAEGVLSPGCRAGECNPASLILAEMIGIEQQPDLSGYMEMVTTMNRRG